MKSKILYSILFMFLFGCASPQGSYECEKPLIKIGSSCCVDENLNDVCDDLEKK